MEEAGPSTPVKEEDVVVGEEPTDRRTSKRHSFFAAVPLTRRMQEGAWGTFQTRGRRSLERLKNRVSSRFMGRPVNLYLAILVVFAVIIGTIVYVEVVLRPSWKDAETALQEMLERREVETTPSPSE